MTPSRPIRQALLVVAAMGILPLAGRAGLIYQFTGLNYPGSQNTLATSINNSGEVVGYHWQNGGNDSGFILNGGSWTNVSIGGLNTDLYGVNNSGAVVGSYYSSANDLELGNVTGFELGHGTTPRSEYYGINNTGTIVGSVYPTGHPASGFYMIGGTITPFAYPAVNGTFVHGINDSGQMVGFYRNFDGTYGSFLDTVGNPTQFTSIGVSGAISNFAYGINNNGLIVGVTEDSSRHYQGFLFDGTTYTLLNFPGAQDTFAAGINAQNDIVGWYQGTDGNTHAFEAVPTPEPASAGLLLAALSVLGGRVWLKRRGC